MAGIAALPLLPCSRGGEGRVTVEVDTTLLYGPDEVAYAKAAYAADHPDGPPWGSADQRARGRYLQRASGWHLEQMRHELAHPQPRGPRGVLAWIRRRRQRR